MENSELKQMGEMLVEQGQKLISMAEGTTEETEETSDEYSSEEMPAKKPMGGMFGNGKAKEMIIMNLKKKFNKGE